MSRSVRRPLLLVAALALACASDLSIEAREDGDFARWRTWDWAPPHPQDAFGDPVPSARFMGGRENALLRAMGLTRKQLRRAMATEGLLLSGVATVMGVALGLVFAWIGVEVLIGTVVAEVGLTVPVLQVVAVAVVAALAGLAACVVPARKAARVAPAAGLALD